MSKRKPRKGDLAYLSRDEPIVLVGQPEALRGEVGLHNQGAKSVVLREVQVRSEPLTRVGAATPMTYSLPPVALRSGQTRYVPLDLAIGRHTPPGEYHGELEVAEHVLPIVLHVIETVQLDISPSQLVIESRVGATVDKRAVFSNRGNIPLTIGAIGSVPLDDEFLQCRTLRGALDAVGDQKKSLEEYVAEIAHQARAALERAGFLRVYNATGTVVLQPGDVSPIDLKIRVPKTLARHTRYRGVATLYDTDLEFVVVRPPDEQEVPEPAGAAKTHP